MKNTPNLVSINEYLKDLVDHLKTAPVNDPYRVIIESLQGKRKVDLAEIKFYSIGNSSLPYYTGEFKYNRQINTLKKYGIVILNPKGKLILDDRFKKVLSAKIYRHVSCLTKQKRIELEKNLERKQVDPHIIEAVLDNIDNQVPLNLSWKKMPRRGSDASYPQTYSSLCRIVRKYKEEMGYFPIPINAKKARKS